MLRLHLLVGIFVLGQVFIGETGLSAEKKLIGTRKLLSDHQDLEKLKYEMLSTLFKNAATSLKDKTFCEAFSKNGQDTVGKFIAWSLSFYAEEHANHLEAVCEKHLDTKRCTVNFYADSKNESPWACGLRFLYDSKKSKVDTSSIECVGSC